MKKFMNFQSGDRRKYYALCLPEVLMALFVGAMVSTALLWGWRGMSDCVSLMVLERKTQVKTAHAIALLMPKVLNGALGIPGVPEEYQKTFSDIPALGAWRKPVTIVPNNRAQNLGIDWGDELRIVYAVPTANKVQSVFPEKQEVVLSVPPSPNKLRGTTGKAGKTFNWVIFPGASRPLRLKGIRGRILQLSELSEDVASIPVGASLHLLRAAKIYVKMGPSGGPELYCHDVTYQNSQPVVSGIEKASFAYNEEKGVLEVCFLVKHKKKSQEVNTAFRLRNMPLKAEDS